MGGGGAMRAAAKVAGFGVFNGGLRAENPITSAARKAARPVTSVVSSSEDVKLVASSSQNNKIDSSVQKPYWEIDDWEFAGSEDEVFIEPGEKMPRLIFGGAPTIQEAKDATSELKDALEKTYLSSDATTGLAGSFVTGQDPSLLLLTDSEYLETKPCVTSEAIAIPSAPKNAIQAFRFLNESPAAQSVVASIASDSNVWHAVLQNAALVEFLQSQKNCSDKDQSEEYVANAHSSEGFSESTDFHESPSGKGFMDALKNIKQNISVKVVQMMNNLSDTFQVFFGGPAGGEPSLDAEGSAKMNFVERALGASFMGLAVMVIMVVVLKRG